METERLDDLGIVEVLTENLRAEREKVAQLREVIASRDVIGQAKGILMERHKVSEEQAAAFLIRISSGTKTKLYDVAAQLVGTTMD